jgi:hypothetical protein
MSMRFGRQLLLAPLVAAVLLGFATAPAGAAQRAQAVKPKIVRVTPMRVEVGELLTIRGRNFRARKGRNTVIFKGSSGRTAFAKPRRATRRKLVVKVPASVGRLLLLRDGKVRPTRVKLRVLAGRFSAFTPRRLSPVVVGPGGTGGRDGAGGPGDTGAEPADICRTSVDHDGDLLSNALEATLGTNPCLRDTDVDGVEDGYEVQAAIDLNHYPATPPQQYPGKRPYPNALDPGDAEFDYDGDGLRLREEYLLWRDYSADGARRASRPTALFPLPAGERMVYSDGLQTSLDPAPTAPTDPLLNWVLDQQDAGERGYGFLSDGERDADADGLGNWDEIRGRFTESWWVATLDDPKESQYPAEFGNFLDNDDLPRHDAHVNPDIDGDDVLDGADDQDRDGLSNQFEIRRPDDWVADAIVGPAANPWAYVNPFNPCKPFKSERCHEHPPIGYYEGDDMPPVGPDAPPGYPGSAPATPNDGP